ncbi:MAG: hypothetical protein SVR81_00155 [Chloroflexota bacterium]|nr:hypothetical protein [Chloroflexota bacterium]
MAKVKQNIGFSYFTSREYLVRKRVETWFPILRQLGATQVVLESGFDRAIPEDVFQTARKNGLEPIVHFKGELPLARQFNSLVVILDAYAKWDVQFIILGEKPNTKSAWPAAGWHYDHLIDHFLDRFIPIANYAEKIGLTPVLPPLQPGGDYWDTAFLEMVMQGLKQRKMDALLEKIGLASFGFTFNKSLNWGSGGPEMWAGSKPYFTPDGQEDQIGFQNYEWARAVFNRVTGRKPTVLILDAGNPGPIGPPQDKDQVIETLQLIHSACLGEVEPEAPKLSGPILGCVFSLETLTELMEGNLSFPILQSIFKSDQVVDVPDDSKSAATDKSIEHYLLLPAHESGVSDVVLNKVRPIIKQLQPTIGFSVSEAILARRVSVFPDPLLFPEEKINALRLAGCQVEVLPQSGIEIATQLHGMTF